MASIAREKNGNRRIQFVAPDGKRPTIRLGKVSQRAAEAIKFRVEQLLAAKLTGHALEADTARWLADLEPAMTEKLARVGLIAKPALKAAATLGSFLDGYFSRRTDVKASTLIHWRQTERSLLAFFGAERPIATITEGDARDFERWLRTGEARQNAYDDAATADGLKPATARKRVSNAKQFFADAVARELIVRNPFAKLRCAAQANRTRDHFVTREAAAKIIDACPDNEWKLLFALSRFGGLRCPSEHLALRWTDVDWERGRLRVRSSKTEHHEGKGERIIPLFPELRPLLDTAWEQAADGAEFVIVRYRDPNANLRTHLARIIRRAGLEPWGKLFANLRASRATELAKDHAAHVAAAWLGHSTLIANKHYWQVTDADFAKAIEGGAEAAQNPAQQAHETPRTERKRESTAQKKTPVFPGLSSSCDYLHAGTVGPAGLEPATKGL